MAIKDKEMITVHLKRKILWWSGEKLCIVRQFSGTLETLHLEVIDGQGYVVAPFQVPDKYGCYSSEGLLFPIKESVEFVETIKVRQALLPQTPKQELLDRFLEDYNDFCRSEDKLHWVPNRIRELFKKKKDDYIK